MKTETEFDLIAQIEQPWQSGERHAVVITGNTGDDITLGEHAGRVADVLSAHFGEHFDAVLRFDLASGLWIEHGADALTSSQLVARLPLENSLTAEALRTARGILREQSDHRIALIVEGIDDLVPPGPGGPADRASLQLLERLGDDAAIVASEHLIVAVCADESPALGRLSRPSSRWLAIELPTPAEAARLEAVDEAMESESAPVLDGVDTGEIARATRGMSRSELRQSMLARTTIDQQTLQQMRADSIRTAAGGMLELVEPLAGGWESAPGLDHVRAAFEHLVLPDGSLSAFAGDGVLLAGPPGCGKSISIRALAASRPIPCFVLSDLRSRWFGESEQNLTRVFRILDNYAPCLVFIDEFDQQIGSRGGGGDNATHEVDKRMLGKFLAYIEDSRRAGTVLWVGATNVPTAIDDAMLSRLTRVLPVLLPGPCARGRVLEAVARSFPLSDHDIDWSAVALSLPNTASRDLESIVRRSALMTSGLLSREAVDTVVASWRRPGSLADLDRASDAALSHVRFTLDMPSRDDLPEHLQGRVN